MKATKKQEIDWDKCREYVAGAFSVLESDVKNDFSYLKRSEPVIRERDSPPRIELWFTNKSGELEHQAKNEVKREQIDISAKVTELAEKNELRVWGGGKNDEGKWVHKLGLYTFKPQYSDFKK